MTYQVLARKWRPQDFSSVVGQEPIVIALRNAVTEGRIAQAYLFSGIRGVGKTSVARILAKALNCENGPAADPCNRCTTCREITSGSDLDVIEVDAATYSKVEQVRELTESLKYGPARDRYKVVVVDEIHRLSRQAFDALLKIVEEPPPHLVFVFATTEIDAVPATILSRCQEFRFRRVPSQELADHLAAIAGDEQIQVSETALRLIARAGDGSVRDSVALLDQLATYGSGTIADEEAARILGGVDHAVFRGLLEAIVRGDSPAVSGVVCAIEEQGWDPRHVYGEFLGYCRDALHLVLGASRVDLPAEEAGALGEVAREAGYENLLRLLNQLLASEHAVRRSETGSLALEIAWLRAAEQPKLVAIEDFLKGGGGAGEAASKKSAVRTRARRAAETEPAPAAEPTPPADVRADSPAATDSEESAGAVEGHEVPEPPAPASNEMPPGAGSEAENAPPAEPVARFLQEVSRLRQPLAAHLQGADRLVFADGLLQIYALPDDPWLNRAVLARAGNKKTIEEALAAVWGPGAAWKLVESAGRPAAEPLADEDAPARELALGDARVQAVLDIFGGAIDSITDGDPAGEGR